MTNQDKYVCGDCGFEGTREQMLTHSLTHTLKINQPEYERCPECHFSTAPGGVPHSVTCSHYRTPDKYVTREEFDRKYNWLKDGIKLCFWSAMFAIIFCLILAIFARADSTWTPIQPAEKTVCRFDTIYTDDPRCGVKIKSHPNYDILQDIDLSQRSCGFGKRNTAHVYDSVFVPPHDSVVCRKDTIYISNGQRDIMESPFCDTLRVGNYWIKYKVVNGKKVYIQRSVK